MNNSTNFHFFLNTETFEETCIPLAQGLLNLGYNVSSNLNYWKEFASNGKYLFNEKYYINLEPENDILIYSSKYVEQVVEFDTNNRYVNVLIDSEDGGRNTTTRKHQQKFKFILKCHYNNRHKLSTNVFPWSFSLPNHSIIEIDNILNNCHTRYKRAEVSFRNNHQMRNHGLNAIEKEMNHLIEFKNQPIDLNPKLDVDSYLSATYPRLDKDYFSLQVRNEIAICFGGWIEFSQFIPCNFYERLIVKSRLGIPKNCVYCQFDSWRIWESLAMKQTVLMFDLDIYDCILPVQPINGFHYIGIDMRGKIMGRNLMYYLQNYKAISENGYQFFQEHYTPTKIAERFLKLL
jgi:hypothetical protein